MKENEDVCHLARLFSLFMCLAVAHVSILIVQ